MSAGPVRLERHAESRASAESSAPSRGPARILSVVFARRYGILDRKPGTVWSRLGVDVKRGELAARNPESSILGVGGSWRRALLGIVAVSLSACSSVPSASDQAARSSYLEAWSAVEHDAKTESKSEEYRRSMELLRSPLLATLPASVRHMLLLRTAAVGVQANDFTGAYRLAVRSTAMAEAASGDWLVRLDAAYFAHYSLDASRSLARLARGWPAELRLVPVSIVRRVAGREPQSAAERQARFDALEALYEARWTDEYGVEPAALWGELVRELAERGELREAVSVAAHVDSPRVMVLLRADKRFDALVREAPARFDVAAAGEREVRDWARAAERFPRKLDALVQLTYALLDVGRYKRAYQITSAILAQVDSANLQRLFDDDGTSLNWILDNHARALEGLQDWKGAEWVLRSAADRLEHGERNVSNIINLAQFEADLGRGDEALRVLGELPANAENMAPYGRMQWYDAQLAAAIAKRDTALEAESLAYLAAHRSAALSTYQVALVRANRLSDAAKLLIQRLGDPATRGAALADMQRYQDPPAPQAAQAVRDRWRELAQRPDVQEAVGRVGRMLDVSLPRPLA